MLSTVAARRQYRLGRRIPGSDEVGSAIERRESRRALQLDDGYDYDLNGNVAAISDGATGTGQRGNRTMGYDGLDRLTSVVSPMWGGGTASYTYDALDNLKRVVVPATLLGVARDHQYHYTSNRLSSVTNTVGGATVIGLGYDVQGNLANKNGTLFAFDFGNRLRTAAGDTYRYDAYGRRVRVTGVAGKLFHFYGRDGQLFWLRDEPDLKRRQFVYLGGSLVAEYTLPIGGSTETVVYQHTDALGSPTVRTSQTRAVLERSEFEPFGKLINRANDDLPGYTGHVMDSGTGLTYMQQRYYDPGIGMFLSVDAVTAYSDSIGQFHRYRYANANPFTFTDPDGRRSREEADHKRDEANQNSMTSRCMSCEGRIATSAAIPNKHNNSPIERQQAIDRAIQHFDIDTRGANVSYQPMNVDGTVIGTDVIEIGDKAFQSLAHLGSVIGHETIHIVQAQRGLTSGSDWAQRLAEAQAYRFQILSAERFGSSYAEVAEYRKQFENYTQGMPERYLNRIEDLDDAF